MNILPNIQAAAKRIAPYVLRTPVEYSPYLSQLTGAQVWLKLEHIQTTGSFKLRGAANALCSLTAAQREKGVITASSGNHGMAVAYMAHQLGCTARIYLPETVAQAKVDAMKPYSVELHLQGEDAIVSEHLARKTATSQDRAYISPYNDTEVIAGQGTIGVELAEQLPQLESVFVPVGGGGLISGIGAYLKSTLPKVEIIGCQPENSAVMHASVQAGKVLDIPSLPTLSDGTAGGLELDAITLPFCQQYVDTFHLVSEAEIQESLLILLKKHYYLVEGAAALSVASLIQNKKTYRGKNVVLILCGRKMGLDTLRAVIQEE